MIGQVSGLQHYSVTQPLTFTSANAGQQFSDIIPLVGY